MSVGKAYASAQKRSMPVQKPGRSRQDYRTPAIFMRAAERVLNITHFTIDLAAHARNAQVSTYFSPEENSLAQLWNFKGWGWLNPPFADITPWVRKAALTPNARIAVLVPASTGSTWWDKYVHAKAEVYLLKGRLSFDGKAPYPKDCALLLYDKTRLKTYTIWDWRKWV